MQAESDYSTNNNNLANIQGFFDSMPGARDGGLAQKQALRGSVLVAIGALLFWLMGAQDIKAFPGNIASTSICLGAGLHIGALSWGLLSWRTVASRRALLTITLTWVGYSAWWFGR